MININNRGSFIAISDFHSCEWPIKKIEDYYLNEYQTIYILGDATDRGKEQNGKGGINLLFKIKELSEKYPGRVIYIPGNHDSFVYDYATYHDVFSSECMKINQGSETIKDIDTLRYNDPRKLQELINWLGTLPLQREHFYNNKRYVLAHALFNETLFRMNKNFNLRNYNGLGGYYGVYGPILWFRKQSDSYNRKDLPRGDSIMIVGHTPESSRKGVNLDLTNAYNEKIKVFCVDGGIASGNPLLKYDGGEDVLKTYNYSHRRTAPQKPKIVTPNPSQKMYTQTELENIFKNEVIKLLDTSSTADEALLKLFKISVGVREQEYSESFDRLTKPEIKEYMSDQLLYYATKSFDKNDPQSSNSMFKATKKLLSKIALDHIIGSLIIKYKSIKQAENNLSGYFTESDLEYITESVGHARSIASKFQPNDLSNVIMHSDHPTISEYIKYEYGHSYKKKQ